ncbi:hypothetical protein [Psychromonas sp. SP041]|uniref:hypothetical protein n=1 Tax=Psychromonas sp. SP041 TaxID=1365007 RepID=UPI000400C04B|nr:hypothetical protein [Psychromonas sp. SP041]
MQFVHGSKQKLTKFQLFDHTKNNNVLSNEFVDNGIDARGPGVYCFSMDDPNTRSAAIEAAQRYSGPDGYLYFFSVDAEEEDLLNNIDVEEMSERNWEIAVENVVDSIRGQDWETNFDQLTQSIKTRLEDGEEIEASEVVNLFSAYDIRADDCDPTDLDPDDWEQEMQDIKLVEDPASRIFENGGPSGIIEYARNKSDHGWQFLMAVWEGSSVSYTNGGIETLNNTFFHAVSRIFKEETPVGAYIEEDDFYVMFDVDAISIDKVIELTPVEPELAY